MPRILSVHWVNNLVDELAKRRHMATSACAASYAFIWVAVRLLIRRRRLIFPALEKPIVEGARRAIRCEVRVVCVAIA